MCSSAPSRLAAPSYSPSAAGAAAVAAYDKNSNGKIELAEMSPALKICVKDKVGEAAVDANGDGALDAGEIAARVDSYVKNRIGVLSCPCFVTMDGKPLPTVTLTLVPEPFLADTIKPASATTDDKGTAIPKAEGQDGVMQGFYRIEISKKDASGKETIPAKYNSQTELGCEIAQGIESFRGGAITLKLESGAAAPKKK